MTATRTAAFKHLKYQFLQAPVFVPLKALQRDYQYISTSSSCSTEIFRGRGCEILDLTYIDPLLSGTRSVAFAGTTTERAIPNYLDEAHRADPPRRLQVGRQTDPLADDRNHNCIKKPFQNLETVQWLKSLGDLAKVTVATLKPLSWWPSHYDFSSWHASKANIPIFTNPDAVSLSWNQRSQRLEKVYMKEEEFWFINTAFKHTAFNWGKTPRTFLLVTFNSPNKHLEFS